MSPTSRRWSPTWVPRWSASTRPRPGPTAARAAPPNGPCVRSASPRSRRRPTRARTRSTAGCGPGSRVFDAVAESHPRYLGGDGAPHGRRGLPRGDGGAARGRLRGRDEPKATFRRQVLADHGVDPSSLRTVDAVDAALAALTGLLALAGDSCTVGDPAEGVILLPVRTVPEHRLVRPRRPRSVSGPGAVALTSAAHTRRRAAMIPTAPFGRTGHASSRVIFGAAALASMRQERADEVLADLLRHGVNHLDTAADYGDSELRIAPWMVDHRDRLLPRHQDRRPHRRRRPGRARALAGTPRRRPVDLIQLHNLVEPDEWEVAARARRGGRGAGPGPGRGPDPLHRRHRARRPHRRACTGAASSASRSTRCCCPTASSALTDDAYRADVDELLGCARERGGGADDQGGGPPPLADDDTAAASPGTSR